MKYLIAVFILLSSVLVFADGESTTDVGTVFDIMTDISNWFENGLYESADSIFQRMAAWVIVWIIDAKLFMLGLGLEVAEVFIDAIGISQFLNSSFSSLDNQTANFVTYLKIPEAVNLLISAYTTRFVMGLI
jgi:hypothetical protein